MARPYADAHRGWPVFPTDVQHPVRASFLDPRLGELYHNGIDVSVRDDQPEAGAPPGGSHRVFALEGGVVWGLDQGTGPENEGAVRAGHFGYGHLIPLVARGDKVKTGQLIGWTVLGEWHVHLTEWFFPDGDREWKVPVNPLSKDGKISPYVDTAPPLIQDVRFFTPVASSWRRVQRRIVCLRAGDELDPANLSGVVDVRARIEDPQSFQGWFADLPNMSTLHHPAEVYIAVISLETGKRILERRVFQAEFTLGPEGKHIPFSNHFAPGTRQNLRAPTVFDKSVPGQGELWFRLFGTLEGSYWDTTTVPNGRYQLRVTAWDVAGNKTKTSVEVTVVNP